jgi:general secretion pathway protein G
MATNDPNPKPPQRKLHPEAGVTLTEMMVVIVIIGLITAVVAINVLPTMDTARATKARADISGIEQALLQYRSERARYPSMEEGLAALVNPPDDDNNPMARDEPYIMRLPKDPWGRDYQYVIPGAHGPYDLYSFGADGRDGGTDLDADIGNWQEEDEQG